MNSAYFSVAGPKGDNQDAVLMPTRVDNRVYFAVADGVGGSELGSLAAQTVIAEIKSLLPQYDEDALELFAAARRAVIKVANGKDAATTLTFVAMTENVVTVAHVGDSRLYHLRGKGIMTRTNDQTEIAQLVRQGVFSQEEAKFYKRKNVIVSAIASNSDYTIERQSFDVVEGDLLVACTDGVYNVIRKRDIVDINCRRNMAEDVAADIIRFVADAGPSDDYSGVIVRV